MRIFLNGMKFHSYHGVYPKEKVEGGSFEVDLELEIKTNILKVNDSLENTLDYSEIYLLVSKIMATPVNLLEELALRIGRELKSFYPIGYYRIRISKLQPPLGGTIERVSIEIDSTEVI